MIGIEDLFGLQDVDFAAGSLGPGQHRQPLDVVARERVVGGHGRHTRQAAQFLQRFFLDVLGHARGFDLLAQLFGVALAFVLLAQFFLDRLHLLAQVVLALRLLHPVLHFGLDLVAQLLDFEFFGQMLVDFFQAHPDVGVSSVSCLSGVDSDGSDEAMKSTSRPGSSMFIATVESSSDSVGEPATICWNSVSTLRCSASISESLGGIVSGIVVTRARMKGASCAKSASRTRSRPSANTNRLWLGILTTLCTTASVPMAYRSVGCGKSTRLALRHHHDGLVFAQRVNQLHGTFPPHGQRQHRMGKQHRVPHRQNRQRALGGFVRSEVRNRIAHDFP